MGFTKERARVEPDIAVVAAHPRYEGEQYIFYFSRRLSPTALEARNRLWGMSADEREGPAFLPALCAAAAALASREPSGFDDFPEGAERPLAERFVEYFNDPDQPELEAILLAAWNAYWEGARPWARLKSLQDSLSGGSQLQGVPGEAAPVAG
jgi:hypothetical protein